MKIIILVDYRNQLWLKSDYKEQSVDVRRLAHALNELDCHVKIFSFAEINPGRDKFKDTFILYQSSEDPGLHYKSFIEDKLLALKLSGARLIPEFEYFRAHHNKVFMEQLRLLSNVDAIAKPRSWVYGTYEEYICDSSRPAAPLVFKLSEGAQSKHVRLMNSESEKKRIPKRLTKTFDLYYWLVDKIKPYLKKRYPHYRVKSHHRNKFVVQEFISGLSGDYKVLIFANKCYVLERRTRKNDFRASGSGLFSFPETCPSGLIDFADSVYKSFDVPYISLDIAVAHNDFYLLEFQFVSFGTYTMEKAPHYFDCSTGQRKPKECDFTLEREFACAVVKFIGAHS